MNTTNPLRDRLDNWRRAHVWFAGRGQCFSLEGRWRSPQHWEELTTTMPPSIDILDAWNVELAWRSITSKGRWVIKLNIISRSDIGDEKIGKWGAINKCAREVRSMTAANVQPKDWREHVQAAKLEISDALDEMDCGGKATIIARGNDNLLQVLAMFGINRVAETVPEKSVNAA
jgi:hypothetical protein